MIRLALILMLTGCTVSMPKFDESLLEPCQETPALEGMTGAEILSWAKVSGPIIVDCRTNHNALVQIIKAAK